MTLQWDAYIVLNSLIKAIIIFQESQVSKVAKELVVSKTRRYNSDRT